MHIKRRRLLVILLLVSQVGCMVFGLVWAAGWLRQACNVILYRGAEAESRALLSEFARRTSDSKAQTIELGTADWDRLQRLCEQIVAPHEGFVSIIRRDTGALSCQSDLKENPSLLERFPGRLSIVSPSGAAPMSMAARKAETADQPMVLGSVEFSGKLYTIACLSVPKLNAILAVYQLQASIDNEAAALVDPLFQVGLVLIVAVAGATGLLSAFLVSRVESTLTGVNSSLEQEVDLRTHSLTCTRNAVVFGLAKLGESRDKDVAGHLDRVRSYVTLLASELAKRNSDIDRQYVANLSVASALHDVGKAALPDDVLLKSGRLTPGERRVMQMHTTLGGECLAGIQRQLGEDDFLEVAQQIAVAHHEQWDGSGYPEGLQGKEIPLPARIVAVADVYDALTSDRPYRPALSHHEAREWIVEHYGTQFDPEVVEAFVAREQDFARISRTGHHAPGPATADGVAATGAVEPSTAPTPSTAV